MLLITPTEVIAAAFTSREKISEQSIRPLKIDIAQEHYIRPRFGEQFFEKMCEGEYADLVESLVKPALAQYVRYGVIDELTIQLSDNGAIIYGSTDSVVEKNDSSDQSKNSTQTISDEGGGSSTLMRTDKESGETTQTDNLSEETFVNSGIANNTQGSVTAQNIRVNELASNASINSTTTDAKTNLRENQSKSTLGRNDESSENRRGRTLRTASNTERRVIGARALADANILLAKAVRYVERNEERFPLYLPSTALSRIFF